MSTFTSSLPDDLLRSLAEKASKLSMSKNKLIENSLRLYLEHLDKAEYIKSYQQAATDKDLIQTCQRIFLKPLKSGNIM